MPTPSQSAEALKEAKQKLDDLQIPFCLFLGTALGAYRDGTFCPGDEDDVDIAVMDTYYDRIPDIKEAFKDWTLYHHLVAKDGLCQELSFKKTQMGGFSKVDIFFISEIDGKLAWRFYMGAGERETITKYLPKEHFKHFDKVNFFGTEYSLPGNIEKYLELNYGANWRTPIHRKDWVWYQDNQAPIKPE